jgi:hypothetical protein
MSRRNHLARYREITRPPERPQPGMSPPSSTGHDPELVPELRRSFRLNALTLRVALAALLVAFLTLLVAVATLVVTLVR